MTSGLGGTDVGRTGLGRTELVLSPTPSAHFGAGVVGKLPGIVRGTGADAAVVVTDAALAATPVVASVTGVLEAAGMPVTVFRGVHPNPTTDDLAAGADAVAGGRRRPGPDRWWRWAADRRSTRPRASPWRPSTRSGAATWTTAASSRPRRCRIVAVPTTAGTGAETNAFGVVTDPAVPPQVLRGPRQLAARWPRSSTRA